MHRALQQLHIELALQVPDPTADGGKWNAQVLGSGRQAAGLRRGREHADRIQIHAAVSWGFESQAHRLDKVVVATASARP